MRSYYRAAKRMPMSVQGLTKAIRTLEQRWKIELFGRGEDGKLIPTRYADTLYEFAKQYEIDQLRLGRLFDRISAQKKHEIRLGSSVGMIGLLGSEYLTGLEKEHPDISLTYAEYSDSDCDQVLKGELVDLAFTIEPHPDDFITTPLLEEQVELWAHVDNPLSAKERLNVADLEGQNIAMGQKAFKIHSAIIQRCAEAEVTLGQIYEILEMHCGFEFVLKNKGLGFTVSRSAKMEVFQSNTSVVSIPLDGLAIRFGLSYLPSHQLTDAEQRFYDYTVQYTMAMAPLV
jgi:DNA-binding transcriptional LysR family regulator